MLRSRRGFTKVVAALTLGALVAMACGSDDDSGGSAEPVSSTGEAVPVEVVLGWLPGMNQGGDFAAIEQGFFEEAGIEWNFLAGMEASPMLLVASGRSQFGKADADEILLARAEGIPVVALYPTYQATPRIIVYHEENPAESFQDFEGRTIYGPAGRAWWDYVKEREGIQTTEREYSAQAFLQDSNALIQAYYGDLETVYTNEAEGAELGAIPVAPTGWNPYSAILFTSERFLEENPEVVQGVVDALHRGWLHYRDNYESVNEFMASVEDTDTSVPNMNIQAQARDEIIYGPNGDDLGQMLLERWEETLEALVATGSIDASVADGLDVSAAFTTEFLPGG